MTREVFLSGRQDSNLRPPGPKPGAITGLRYAPNVVISSLNYPGMDNQCVQRRGRDSNPRYRFKSVQRFSKPALSATQAPLRFSL